MAAEVRINIISGNLCGICEQEGERATKRWDNHISYHAHPSCFQWIQTIDDELNTLIKVYFPHPRQAIQRCGAHREALVQIKKEIAYDSILEFLNEHGSEKLAAHFTSQKVKDAIKEFQAATSIQIFPSTRPPLRELL